MNIERYKPNGYKDVTKNITPEAADMLYQPYLTMVRIPFSKYSRVLIRHDDGVSIIRDTEYEVWGRASSREHYRSNGFAVAFASDKGE